MGRLIPRLQQSWTRELAWSLFSPDLFSRYPSPLRPDAWSMEWLKHLDQYEPGGPDLPERLGVRFERLIARYLTDHPEWQLLGQNIQVRDTSRTIGELDFIAMRMPDKQVWHIEAAVKFYLQTPWGWYGPDTRDTLQHKYMHMKNHQLRLHEHPAARSQLDRYGISQNLASAMHAKGWLFGRRDQLLLPDFVNPAIQTGSWEFAEEQLHSRTYLHKSRWLDPVATDTNQASGSIDRRPIMINNHGRRQFLVPEIWLQTLAKQNNGQTV